MKVGTMKNFNVEVCDASDNRVTSPAVTVTFEKATGAGTVSFTGGPTALSLSGIATKVVQATGVGAITVRARSGTLTPALAPLTVTR
jgi:hypothetical protein